jgi:hypothetical protein
MIRHAYHPAAALVARHHATPRRPAPGREPRRVHGASLLSQRPTLPAYLRRWAAEMMPGNAAENAAENAAALMAVLERDMSDPHLDLAQQSSQWLAGYGLARLNYLKAQEIEI